ncbi:hypothetical protein MtrunA17_Chr7g0254271 [Medicago truncatula]|uniref:Uncharacterized protein n=1 Tax=Medicago truncatula TaxID=3880 RepID=A2Q4D2_MEDTR|nr:hypothetical protein MtrDRAFT_AC157472g29v2 [Medicago truncatula]AES80960.1 hypothetical protein MTR_7g086970 [Medicago truncatula]RHN47558.1 hypothetical protein MtrunA17_Chr7g0254271 [Medicago truncatula]
MKTRGLYDNILLPKKDFYFDIELFYGFIGYRSISTNTFVFRYDMISLTLLDVIVILELSLIGEEASSAYISPIPNSRIAFSKNTFRYSKFLASMLKSSMSLMQNTTQFCCIDSKSSTSIHYDSEDVHLLF